MEHINGIEVGIALAAQALAIKERQNEAIALYFSTPNEKIACRNATVLVDERGEISWIDNDKPPCIYRNGGLETL